MNDTIRLGRIGGVEIGLNWSALLLVALVTWSYARELNVALALTGALLLLVSILLHELGHTAQAHRDGMRTDGITLWMFGGVARFKGSFPSAGAEFRIAIAGPLVSVGLAIAFTAGYFAPGLTGDLQTLAQLLAVINGVLFLFNLLPALPLDGGRMLRAALWQWTGDFAKGTRIAARVSGAFAVMMIAGGALLALFTQSLISGLWFAFIGWFLFGAARAEERSLVAHEALGDLVVRDVMTPPPPPVEPGISLAEFVERTSWQPPGGSYPVVHDGNLVGLVLARDLAEVPRELWDRTRVAQVMQSRKSIPAVTPDELLANAATNLGDGIDRVPVISDERLVGLLTLAALAQAFGQMPGARPAAGS